MQKIFNLFTLNHRPKVSQNVLIMIYEARVCVCLNSSPVDANFPPLYLLQNKYGFSEECDFECSEFKEFRK